MMSEALYGTGGLRFWTEREIMLREQATARLSFVVKETLTGINDAWTYERVDGPIMTPHQHLNAEYGNDDVWCLEAPIAGGDAALRPETTASSYAYMQHVLQRGRRLPLCVWQAGKSFRRETNDGASPSKLRFNEFYQLEFQCAFKADTKADYISPVIVAVAREIQALTGCEARIVDSDRLPAYSMGTKDVEVHRPNGRWTEMCSISLRTDMPLGHPVLEIAAGLDRLVAVQCEKDTPQ